MILCWKRGRIVLYVTVCFPFIYLDAYCAHPPPSSSNQTFLQYVGISLEYVGRRAGKADASHTENH